MVRYKGFTAIYHCDIRVFGIQASLRYITGMNVLLGIKVSLRYITGTYVVRYKGFSFVYHWDIRG